MPAVATVSDWKTAHPSFSVDFARARDDGHDYIAAQCLEIADTPLMGEVEVMRETKDGPLRETRREDMLGHRKLQIETRLKLLAKWDKRYRDRPSDEDDGQDREIAITGGLPDED